MPFQELRDLGDQPLKFIARHRFAATLPKAAVLVSNVFELVSARLATTVEFVQMASIETAPMLISRISHLLASALFFVASSSGTATALQTYVKHSRRAEPQNPRVFLLRGLREHAEICK